MSLGACRLNSDRSLDGRMRVVAAQGEVLEAEIVDVRDGGIQRHRRQGTGFAADLLASLIEMIRIQVKVAKSVNKVADLEPANLGDHHRKERIAGDVKRHSEEAIGTALI